MLNKEVRKPVEPSTITKLLCTSGRQVLDGDTLSDVKAGNVWKRELFQNLEEKEHWDRLMDFNEEVERSFLEGVGTEVELDGYIDSYLSVLEQLVEESKKRTDPTERGKFVQQLEDMVRWKCCMLQGENMLLVPHCHPIEMAVREFKEKMSQISGSALVNAIVNANIRRNSQYTISLSNEVFLRKEENLAEGYEIAVPFKKAGSLTGISSIRFIEKVSHYMNNRRDSEQRDVRIACIGSVEDPEAIEEYYRDTKAGKVSLICLEKMEQSNDARLLFQVSDRDKGRLSEQDRRQFNLLALSDLEMLFKQFNMVFFMDEGCFYQSEQTAKVAEERMISTYLRWLHGRADNRDDQASENEQDNLERLLLYKSEFESIGGWLNTMDSVSTAELQFNEKLFQVIQNVAMPECDVYLYISRGNRIGDEDLYWRNICNDENYDGKKVSVYKLPYQRKNDVNKAARKLIGAVGNHRSSKEIRIDLWKLVKSIDNTFYKKYLDDMGIPNRNEGIKILKNSFLVLRYQGKKNITCALQPAKEIQGRTQEKQAMEFIAEVMKEGFWGKTHRCVSEYLRKLLAKAVVSRAGSIEDIVFGYLLDREEFDQVMPKEVGLEPASETEMQDTLGDGLFEIRRIIYSIVENLNEVRLRDYSARREYLLYIFRRRFCSDLDIDTFQTILQSIHKAAENLGYKESRLFSYSDLGEEDDG